MGRSTTFVPGRHRARLGLSRRSSRIRVSTLPFIRASPPLARANPWRTADHDYLSTGRSRGRNVGGERPVRVTPHRTESKHEMVSDAVNKDVPVASERRNVRPSTPWNDFVGIGGARWPC